MKCTVMFQYSIYDMHFGIMESELILGIPDEIIEVFSDKFFFYNSAMRQIPLFANKKKDLVRIELTFLPVRGISCVSYNIYHLKKLKLCLFNKISK